MSSQNINEMNWNEIGDALDGKVGLGMNRWLIIFFLFSITIIIIITPFLIVWYIISKTITEIKQEIVKIKEITIKEVQKNVTEIKDEITKINDEIKKLKDISIQNLSNISEIKNKIKNLSNIKEQIKNKEKNEIQNVKNRINL